MIYGPYLAGFCRMLSCYEGISCVKNAELSILNGLKLAGWHFDTFFRFGAFLGEKSPSHAPMDLKFPGVPDEGLSMGTGRIGAANVSEWQNGADGFPKQKERQILTL
jgi:hypothetical protein